MKANNLPENWCHERLRELATINYGKSPKDILSDEGTIPVVGTGGVERYGNACLYDGESIILGRKGTIDRVTYVDGEFWAIDTTYYLSDFQNVNVKWLYYLLQTIDFRLLNEATGVPSLSRELLYKIKILTPTPEEQTQIAAILSTLDSAIERTEAIIAKQQRIKTGLMQDLLTKGIDEDGAIRSEATHKFKDSPLGRIPVEWDVSSISKYGAKDRPFLRTGPFGSSLNTKHWVEEGVPVFTIGSLGEGEVLTSELLYVSEQTADLLSNYRVVNGDIVFSRVADIGRALVVTERESGWIISSNFMRISLDQSVASPLFLYRNIAFNGAIHSQLRTASNAGGRDLVNGSILSGLIFPWPTTEEQDRINNAIANIDKPITVSKAQREKLVSTKAGLMFDLLTGKTPIKAPSLSSEQK